jgi:hypothetical protein
VTANTSKALSRLDRLWLCEAIRLREEHAGALEDAEANRRAQVAGGDLPSRIEHRALWLAERDGLRQALQHWRQGAQLALAGLLLLALLSGAGLALAALGNGQRPVNLVWALGSLLGLHLVLLLGWALSLAARGGDQGTAALGRVWLWLSATLARDARAAQLAPALLVLLQRQRLGRWALGSLVHGLWLVALLSALLTLLALLASRRYGFIWESTLLGPETFIALTQTLGALPAWLGFSLPDAATIRASGDTPLAGELARQAWAGWLLGALLVYGLLPRLLLVALCIGLWQRGKTRLHLDLTHYDLLRERLLPSSERLAISDAAPAWPETAALNANLDAKHTGYADALLVGLELDRPWPPALPAGVTDAGLLDSREQRQRLLEQLSRFPPARLVIACDPRRSPDRGSLALLGELARTAAATRIWLLPPPPGETLDPERLGDWHTALQPLGLAYTDRTPITWLETGHVE